MLPTCNWQSVLLTSLAMVAFAGNSLLCRLALRDTGIDAASFTTIRIVAGAVVLWLVTTLRRGPTGCSGSWPSAVALFAYAAGFSFAYLSLSAGTGALLLFTAVQVTMIGYGLRAGERLAGRQVVGLVIALTGLAGLLLPGISAPSPAGTVLMLGAGAAWGIYSLRGRGAGDPVLVTTGNFLRAVPLTVLFSVVFLDRAAVHPAGAAYAVASGALASAAGYVVWYLALPRLPATTAAVVQLSVPAIAAIGGIVFLGEPVSLRLLVATLGILGGIALVIVSRSPAAAIR
jgi:drug/metabolite transporter (DMT)-like permease